MKLYIIFATKSQYVGKKTSLLLLSLTRLFNGIEIDNEMFNLESYQCIVTLLLMLLMTLIRTLSPSLARRVGPGNLPLTVAMDLVEQSFV